MSFHPPTSILSPTFSRTGQHCVGLASNACKRIDRFLINKPGDRSVFALNCKRWSGVNASRSFRSPLDGVIRRSFSTASTSHSAVRRASSSSTCCPTTVQSPLLTCCTCHSRTPPWWAPYGRLKSHFIPFCIRELRSLFCCLLQVIHSPMTGSRVGIWNPEVAPESWQHVICAMTNFIMDVMQN